MRKSRVLLAGAAVAAAAVTTSAFTASNTVPNSFAGYGSATVTGATVQNITYVADGGGVVNLIDSIDFEVVQNITAAGITATLYLTDGGTIIGTVTCTRGTFGTFTPVTCPTPDRDVETFDGISLKVIQ